MTPLSAMSAAFETPEREVVTDKESQTYRGILEGKGSE